MTKSKRKVKNTNKKKLNNISRNIDKFPFCRRVAEFKLIGLVAMVLALAILSSDIKEVSLAVYNLVFVPRKVGKQTKINRKISARFVIALKLQTVE